MEDSKRLNKGLTKVTYETSKQEITLTIHLTPDLDAEQAKKMIVKAFELALDRR